MNNLPSGSPAAGISDEIESRDELLSGWTLIHSAKARVYRPRSADELARVIGITRESGFTITPRGAGHSFTDAALNRGQAVVQLAGMRRVISWDPAEGVMDVEPGVTIQEVCRLAAADGWWPAAIPGTQYATAGGCAAMNVHGKDHWKKGSFGEQVDEFDLMDSSGAVATVSRASGLPLYSAAIGGAGMLGVFTRLRLRMMRAGSGGCVLRKIPAASLGEMLAICGSEADWADYMFGWIDGFAAGRSLGSGMVWLAQLRGESAPGDAPRPRRQPWETPGVLSRMPVWSAAHLVMNDPVVRAANLAVRAYSRARRARTGEESLGGFCFRMDAVPGWQRVWYPLGVRQFQAFVPAASAADVFCALLRRSQRAGLVPYLCSVKRHRQDPFLLSYMPAGYSLSLDYRVTARNSAQVGRLLTELRDVTLSAGGRLYLAKDDTLDAADYARQTGPEAIGSFLRLKEENDPGGMFASDLYRRVFTG